MPTQNPRVHKRWSRRSEDRPAEIASAALRLFAERGFAATTLEQVARQAGITKGTLYLYFATKEELFRAVVRQELLPNLAGLESFVASYTGSIAALLRLLPASAATLMQSDIAGIPKLVLTEAGNFPEVATFYAEEVLGRGMKLFEQVLRRGIAQGEFREVEPRDLMPIFAGPILILLLAKQSIGRHAALPFDLHTVLCTHIEMFLCGLAPDGAK